MYKAAIYLFRMSKEGMLQKQKAYNYYKQHRIQKSSAAFTLSAWDDSTMSFLPLLLLPAQFVI